MTEFELIARFFDRRDRTSGRGTRLGIGDDCALLAPAPDHALAISTDMLVAGRHFFDDVDPASLGWKTLAVNLSDLAAMGARPLAFTLALALPAVDDAWLASFATGLFACADAHDCDLVGGDTTRGPLNLCVTIFGEVAEGAALRRDRAEVGDDVWVSGTVGTAAVALQRLLAGIAIDATLRASLERPVPRVALGRALVGIAHAAIDVSDGLAQDLGHVLKASGVGAAIAVDGLPVGDAVDARQRRRLALTGGDDYELCFTAPPSSRGDVEDAGRSSTTRVTRIGSVLDGDGLRYIDADGRDWQPDTSLRGFDHFA